MKGAKKSSPGIKFKNISLHTRKVFAKIYTFGTLHYYTVANRGRFWKEIVQIASFWNVMLKENVENILDGDKITNKRIKNGREHDDNDKDMIDRLIRRYAWITNLI